LIVKTTNLKNPVVWPVDACVVLKVGVSGKTTTHPDEGKRSDRRLLSHGGYWRGILGVSSGGGIMAATSSSSSARRIWIIV
jgi:hypothetical protein